MLAAADRRCDGSAMDPDFYRIRRLPPYVFAATELKLFEPA